MDIEDLFKIEPHDPYKMNQEEFIEKTKSVLEKIYNTYTQGWQSRVLRDDEHPEESVCDKCTGYGTFTDGKECVQDREQGDCFHRFCDYEQVGMSLEDNLEDIFDLLSVDEIINTKLIDVEMFDALKRVEAYLVANEDVLAPFPTRSELDNIRSVMSKTGLYQV